MDIVSSKIKSIYPSVAIVGRPNVGKSTLFNRILGRRKSIVQQESGTTRDRVMATVKWETKTVNLIDTGGMKFDKKLTLDSCVDREVEKALKQAASIIFVVDGKGGLTSLDEEIAGKIRCMRKPVVLAVNKIDMVDVSRYELATFYKLGLGDPLPISAAHGLGIGDLMIRAVAKVPATSETPHNPNFTLSIVGEPNSGKSTLLNALLKEERSIVSEVAGTTRDSVEEIIHYQNHYIRIVDTAGMRHMSKTQDASSFFSLLRAKQSIDNSDLTFLMYDVTHGMRRDTKAIAAFLEKSRKPAILVANKWDLMKDVEQGKYEKDMKAELGFLWYAPLIFLSAKDKRNLKGLMEKGLLAWKKSNEHFSTPRLNEFLEQMKRKRLPTPAIRLKFLTQTQSIPQEFVCFVKNLKLIPDNYRRFFENELIEKFGLEGIPIRVHFREDGVKDA